MALTWTQTGTNPDGSPHFTVTSDADDPHFLLTGPSTSGPRETSDGTAYDVTPLVVETASQEHAIEIAAQLDAELAQTEPAQTTEA